MLGSYERPIFLAACACNLAFAVSGLLPIEMQAPLPGLFVLLGGAMAFIVAMALGIRILTHDSGMHSKWVKAGLVFLVLGPLGFSLQWPAVNSMMCMDNCISAASAARAMGDVVQSQLAMIGVAFAAFVCAMRALSVTLDELAL